MPELERDGVTLAYETWGHPEAPAAVLLHDLGGDGRAWLGLAGHMEGDYYVIAPDLRGFGRSLPHELDGEAVPGPWSMADYAADVREILDELGVELAAVIGAGFGGEVALDFAVTWPERVAVLAIAGATPAPDHPAYKEALREREGEMAALEHTAGRFGGARVGTLAALEMHDPFLRGAVRAHYRNVSGEGLAAALRARRERADLTPRLAARLTMPVLVAAGEDDPTRSAADVILAELPEARSVTFRDCGRGVAFVRARAFERALGSFFGDVLSGRPVAGSVTA